MARKPTGETGASEAAGPGDSPKRAPRRKASNAAETSPPEPEAAQVEPPQSGRSTGVEWERLWSIFRVVIDSTAVIGAIGFVLSLIINAIVFGIWGINYFQVASAEDVIISGVMIAIFVVGFIFTMIAPTFLLMRAMQFVQDILRGQHNILKTFVVIVAAVMITVFIIAANQREIIEFMSNDDIPALEIIYAVIFGYLCAGILIVEFRYIGKSTSLLRILIVPFLGFFAALLLIIVLAIGKVGMHAFTPIIYKEASCAKGEPALVLWSGRDRFVYRCPDDKIVVAKKENFEFEVRR